MAKSLTMLSDFYFELFLMEGKFKFSSQGEVHLLLLPLLKCPRQCLEGSNCRWAPCCVDFEINNMAMWALSLFLLLLDREKPL